jgi:hypothetical protein
MVTRGCSPSGKSARIPMLARLLSQFDSNPGAKQNKASPIFRDESTRGWPAN